MIKVFTLPDLGEGLTESEIVAWLVAPGDTVTLNQHIADVETAKAVVELPSPFAGVVSELHHPAGVVVHVGEPIVSFDVGGAEAEPVDASPPAPAATPPEAPVAMPTAAPTAKREANLVGYGPAIERGGHPQRRSRTGGGAVTAASPDRHPRLTTGETRTPIKSLRKLTAAAMVQSAFTAPHVTEFLTVDVTPTVDLIESLRADRQFADAGIGILAVVAKALCLAVGRTPAVNTHWDEPAGEIVQFHHVNLGIAAATPRGLLVPNIVDAERLNLVGLAAALAELTSAARAGTTTPAALSGGTITITNIGVFGIDAGTPILNPGEAAILALGAIRLQPWEYRGEIALRKMLTLSLSFDHRLVDGEEGSRFLADIGTVLAHPERVLTMV